MTSMTYPDTRNCKGLDSSRWSVVRDYYFTNTTVVLMYDLHLVDWTIQRMIGQIPLLLSIVDVMNENMYL